MALESEYFPEQPSDLESPSPEDRGAYRKASYGTFGFCAVTIVLLAGAVIVGTNIQTVAHVVMATWH